MDTVIVCNFNKYGSCRYQERCRKCHEEKACEAVNCEVKTCMLRHPKYCKFLRDYGYCKFGEWCKFSHKAFGTNGNVENEELKELKEKFKNLEKEINSKDDLIKNLEIEIKLHLKINKKLNILKHKESALLDLEVKTNFVEVALEVKTKDTNEKIERIKTLFRKFKILSKLLMVIKFNLL